MMQFWIDFLIQNTIWSIFTCGLIVGLALTLKRRPALIHLVCVLALIAMLMPTLISIDVPGSGQLFDYRTTQNSSLENDTETDISVTVDSSASEPRYNMASLDSLDPGIGPPAEIAESAPESNDARAVVPTIPKLALAWPNTMLLVWLIGGLTYLVFTTRKLIRFNQLIARAKPARIKIQSVVENESQRIGLRRRPVVKELGASISPFVFVATNGPQLVMPTGLANQLTDDELRSLILHELAHLKRRDPLVRFLEIAVTTIFWFNPALWLIRRQLRGAEELACDAVVSNSLKSTPEIYAAAFLKSINFLARHRAERLPSLICTVGGYHFCRKRLEAMVTASNHVGVSPMQGFVAIAMALPLLVAGFQTSPEPTKPSDSTFPRPIVDKRLREIFFRSVPSKLDPPTINKGIATWDAAEFDELTTLDIEVMKELKEVKETPKITFHYRPDDLDEEALAKVVKINLEQFQQCEKLLQMEYEGRVHVFLYRDIADLQKTTGTQAVAFATGNVSVHQSIDFKSVHEFTHILALQFPNDEDAVTDMFACEGLATILAKHDEDVPIHSWAAVYQSRSQLPGLIELRRSWPNGAPARVHPYHVAGSFVGYLIEEFGIEKVKRWYVNSTEAHMEFGKTFRRLERDWHQWLQRRTVEPKHRNHVMAKLGVIPEKYSSSKVTNLFDGKTLGGLVTDEEAKWKVQDGRLVGSDNNTWTFISTEREFPTNVGVRLKFKLVDGKAISVRIGGADNSSNHVNLATWATYISYKEGGYLGVEELKIEHNKWYQVVLVNDNGTARLYFNDLVIREHDDVFNLSEGTVGIGVEGGTIEVEELEVFELNKRPE